MTDAELMREAAKALMGYMPNRWWSEVRPIHRALLDRAKEIEESMEKERGKTE